MTKEQKAREAVIRTTAKVNQLEAEASLIDDQTKALKELRAKLANL